jgi:hypothetical protein
MIKNEKNQTITINENFRKQLETEKEKMVTARTSTLPRGVAEKILETMKKTLELESREQALAIITVLFQLGGTARSCDGNMSVTLFGKETKLAEIRKILKQNSCNKAERKLARTLATEIQEIAQMLELPGNLYSKIQKKDLERKFSTEEKVWLSDFQSDNESCPIRLRNLILETFKKPENNQKKKK